MSDFIKGYWWKIIAIGFVFYSLAAGLFIPLGPGIKGVSPRIIEQAGKTTLSVNTFNVSPSEGELKAFIRLNKTQAICSNAFMFNKDKGTLDIDFEIPTGKLPVLQSENQGEKSPFPRLEIHSQDFGFASYESAVAFAQKDSIAVDSTTLCAIAPFVSNGEAFFPFINILEETARNLYYHVPMWFALLLLLLISMIYAIKALINPSEEKYDVLSVSFAAVGLTFGIVGITTGALWAKFTWGAYWSFDVKQNTSAVALLIYLAYFVLRSSFDDMDKKARVSAVYNIFAYAMLIPLLYIIPRMVDSLHPGNGGNPGFNSYDIDDNMRMVFYPAVIGWILFGAWLATLSARIELLKRKKLSNLFL